VFPSTDLKYVLCLVQSFLFFSTTLDNFYCLTNFFNMRSIASLALFAGLASLTIATPIQNVKKSTTTFRVNQFQTGIKYKHGASALQKAYLKHKKSAPSAVSSAAAASQTGSVDADPEQFDAEYLCAVTVGNTTLNLDFDTGSADL
jgi:hypothetical protein